MKVILLLFNTESGFAANNAMQNVLFNNKPPHLETVFECTPPFADCPQHPGDLGVTTFPTLLFLGKAAQGKYVKVDQLSAGITETAIRQKLTTLQHLPAPMAGGGGIIPGDGDPNNGGLIGFGLDLPEWLKNLLNSKPILMIGIAFSAYKFASANKTTGQVIWGGVTAYFGNQLLKKRANE